MLFEALAILVMLAILSALIIVHEFGHFSIARLFGFQTPVFGFGLPFGPYKVVGKKWGTEFRIHACVLGGYVAIPELGDESNAREENYGVPLKPFRKFPIWQRGLVAFAGPGFNILFAWVIMFAMLATFGDPVQPVVVTRMPASNPIAATAGVKAGDKITMIDNTQVNTPDEIVDYLSKRPNTAVVIHVDRKGQPVDIPMTTNANGKVGMELVPRGTVRYKPLHKNPIELVGYSANKTVEMTNNMVKALGMMVQGIFTPREPGAKHVPGQPPKIGLNDLHGVLAVVAMGADIAKQDWSQLFLFTIMISLDLAIINLLPWPALDGFHLASMAVEGLRGKPMEERAQNEIVKWGFISLLVLMAVIMVNDVRSLMNGELTVKLNKDDQEQAQQKDKDKTSQNTPATGAPAATNTPPAGTPADSTPAAQPNVGAAPEPPAAKH